jgi:hypothetical protein
MIDIDSVLAFVRRESPLLPAKIAKEFNISNLIASAVLSQLVSEKRIEVSTVKIGGSPVYFAPEKRAALQDYSKYLNEKDRRAFVRLQEKKILRDNEEEPLTRACLRAIKDYAKPITVTSGENQELFWKWFLLSDDDAPRANAQTSTRRTRSGESSCSSAICHRRTFSTCLC